MRDDTIQSVEDFLRQRRPATGGNLCTGCSKVLDGTKYLRVDLVDDEGTEFEAVVAVCSWSCLRDLAEELAGGA